MAVAKVLLNTGERVTITGVHPVADLFPMLDKEGIADLAASIGERGLEHPVVLDDQDRVLDGRNRLASCELAGVEPKAVRYDGGDPAGYALAVNITRRHLSTGARAIVAAQASRLNGTTGKDAAANTKIGINRIAEASVILDWAPDLTDAILTGAQPLGGRRRRVNDRHGRRARHGRNHRCRLGRGLTVAVVLGCAVLLWAVAGDDGRWLDGHGVLLPAVSDTTALSRTAQRCCWRSRPTAGSSSRPSRTQRTCYQPQGRAGSSRTWRC